MTGRTPGRPAARALISFAHRVAPDGRRSARLRRRHFPASPWSGRKARLGLLRLSHASLTAAPSIPQRDYDTPGRRAP